MIQIQTKIQIYTSAKANGITKDHKVAIVIQFQEKVLISNNSIINNKKACDHRVKNYWKRKRK